MEKRDKPVLLTPEMVEAGERVLLSWVPDFESPAQLVIRLQQAIQALSPEKQKTPKVPE
jgi:hypothetical protein